MFDEEITYPEIREVLDDNSKSKQEKVEKLKMLLSDTGRQIHYLSACIFLSTF
jgi:hypothetical protein